jgi:hypothetical protein
MPESFVFQVALSHYLCGISMDTPLLRLHVVTAVSAGETYTGGDLVCYAWGNNNHGQLGLGDKDSRSRPVLISAFSEGSSWEVYEIACGASHTAVLTNKKSH